MDKNGYSFVMILKGWKALVSDLVLSVEESFEERRHNFASPYSSPEPPYSPISSRRMQVSDSFRYTSMGTDAQQSVVS